MNRTEHDLSRNDEKKNRVKRSTYLRDETRTRDNMILIIGIVCLFQVSVITYQMMAVNLMRLDEFVCCEACVDGILRLKEPVYVWKMANINN